MEQHHRALRNSFRLALVISILLHLALLSLKISSPGTADSEGRNRNSPSPRLSAVIAKPAEPKEIEQPTPPPVPPKKAPVRKPRPKVITAAPTATPSPSSWPMRSWSTSERSEMDAFLNELAAEAKPPRGQDLATRALGMAGAIGREAPATETGVSDAPSPSRPIEPFSLEMYFDAFVRKLNRSAAFVKNEDRGRGYRKALVQILLNADGTLKSYNVLRSADQQLEIAYIKRVVDRAAPFSAFPRDIANAANSLSIMICITPGHAGDDGRNFSRSFGGQDCRD